MLYRTCFGFVALVVCAGAWSQDNDIVAVKAKIAERLSAVETYSADSVTRMNMGAITMLVKGTARGKGTMSELSTTMDMVGMKFTDRTIVDATGTRWEIRNILGELHVSKSVQGQGGMDASSRDVGLWMGYGSENLDPRQAIQTFEAGYELAALGTETLDGVECYVIGGMFHEEKLEEIRAESADMPDEAQAAFTMMENMLNGFIQVRLHIATADGLPRKMELQNKEGKPTTTLTYTNVVVNQPIDDSVFAYVPPDGIEVEDLDEVESTTSVSVGDVAPAFEGRTLEGFTLALADYKGKVVFLDFWATWCGPCVAELPNVIALYEEYHPKGLELIGISLDGDRTDLEAFLKENAGMKWPQIFDGNVWEAEVAEIYGVEAIPLTVLIGNDGTILGINLQGEALKKAVADALGTAAETEG